MGRTQLKSYMNLSTHIYEKHAYGQKLRQEARQKQKNRISPKVISYYNVLINLYSYRNNLELKQQVYPYLQSHL